MMHRETIGMDEGGETDKSANAVGRISAGCTYDRYEMHFSKIATSDCSMESFLFNSDFSINLLKNSIFFFVK